ncbi:tRNA (adenosine(37)-N6)-threonylcarbamoyltransferase complex ATPase subunit type 1 TsaE [Parapusillimonas granuli]|uniref:tRNA threonylcarbamoyladenosine biosynthesis protein TsaE n=1 Tax=Parapusillimonas granuli TaxID=380911 RepID=A0A853FS10_9BURK|nr:tRNA (adenosine(37)-N6)-threonylcarbamoyltransferase complex ATPase subunit type 1 TsaE [Parapusillimonas granuli]MBB5213819.1 tRNA threonylcarbamoyladenosine biosynthesis protein TsaE [Parapusillimonas granuli]MEB2398898.1 tRNA (adenosine(37)-N6)-threonylcarbamoyltransferase complex ATPase subunit type 1 TsaE [Alcaligenaceae bacterium]NYT48654.1 tRNA (adenosine(37)-N6)-threonylcarbamoyltransferase complex ATPase subunit type 1 TsaE [Parapusillimonas granuli]
MNENTPKLKTIAIDLPDEDATAGLAAQLAPMLCGRHPGLPATAPGGRIHLRGELGAGKTCFTRAFLRAAGIRGRIKSPSYTLLESYNLSNLYFYHLDFYRFSDSNEWLDAGFRDILHENAIVLIEWPEQAGALLPPPDLDIHLEYADTGRQASLTAHSDKGLLWLTTLVLPPPASRPPEPRDAG